MLIHTITKISDNYSSISIDKAYKGNVYWIPETGEWILYLDKNYSARAYLHTRLTDVKVGDDAVVLYSAELSEVPAILTAMYSYACYILDKYEEYRKLWLYHN